MLRLDELTPGMSLPYGTHAVQEANLLAFAREFDPQPMHLDPTSEQAALMGGLIGSGWQTVALNHRMVREALLDRAGIPNLLHVKALRWPAPVRPGDVLSGNAQVISVAGGLRLQHALSNQHGEAVMTLDALYGAADAAPVPLDGGLYPATTQPVVPVPFDRIPPGALSHAGDHCFETAAVARYRALYDPATDDASRHTLAPWHITAQWLRLNIARWEGLEAAGEGLPRRGPGLGLSDVHWPRPAQAGEPLRYFSRLLSARPSSSRPGWGIVTNRNYALNAADEVVVAFSSSVLLEGSLA